MWVYGENAEVVINSGHFVGSYHEDAQCEVVYVNGANSKVIINDGKFEAKYPSEGLAGPDYTALNLYGDGANGADIVVYGGSFYKFDPANNIAESTAKNFCAEGYKSVQNGDWFTVVAE